LDAAFYIDGRLELLERYPPELFPTKADGESLENWRRWYQRMNSGWSEAVEASARVNFTSADPEKRARALGLMIENEARPDHTKIKSPALMITVVNPGAYVVKQLQNLSEERQNAVDDFLAEARQMKEKEIELFRKAIPNGQVFTLTNAHGLEAPRVGTRDHFAPAPSLLDRTGDGCIDGDRVALNVNDHAVPVDAEGSPAAGRCRRPN